MENADLAALRDRIWELELRLLGTIICVRAAVIGIAPDYPKISDALEDVCRDAQKTLDHSPHEQRPGQ